jgi:hypothetical protein
MKSEIRREGNKEQMRMEKRSRKISGKRRLGIIKEKEGEFNGTWGGFKREA